MTVLISFKFEKGKLFQLEGPEPTPKSLKKLIKIFGKLEETDTQKYASLQTHALMITVLTQKNGSYWVAIKGHPKEDIEMCIIKEAALKLAGMVAEEEFQFYDAPETHHPVEKSLKPMLKPHEVVRLIRSLPPAVQMNSKDITFGVFLMDHIFTNPACTSENGSFKFTFPADKKIRFNNVPEKYKDVEGTHLMIEKEVEGRYATEERTIYFTKGITIKGKKCFVPFTVRLNSIQTNDNLIIFSGETFLGKETVSFNAQELVDILSSNMQ